jgi:5-(carboxyamino)imidazole ribonucleotide synthase
MSDNIRSNEPSLGPGATLGVVGGGQLGRYFVLAARQLGYETWVLDPDANAPAMQLAAMPVVAAYDDEHALNRFGAACDAVTIEFENVPAASLERLASLTRLAPEPSSVALSQDRLAEKRAALECGLEPVAHSAVRRIEDIPTAIAVTGLPAILKTARMGYDGKGQALVATEQEVVAAWQAAGAVDCVLEQRVALAAELSVIVVRGFDGQSVTYPVARNEHVGGILHLSTAPSELAQALEAQAVTKAVALADGLRHVGVLAVEFFVGDQGQLWFNEMAPRPHNSGHYSLDATACSQFEQQLRALCALPFGDTRLIQPVSMLNLLGDAWTTSDPSFARDVLSCPGACLHLYGKSMARPGRKMGHVNILSASASEARELAESMHRQLFAPS